MKKKLEEMTVRELLMTDEFVRTLGEVIENERQSFREVRYRAYKEGRRLQRNPIDRLEERGVFNTEDMQSLYAMVVAKCLTGYSASERNYIELVGRQAYRVTIQKLRNTDG